MERLAYYAEIPAHGPAATALVSRRRGAFKHRFFRGKVITDEPFYRTVGAAYEFVFADPSGWDSGHYYFSKDVPLRGHWEKW